MNLTAEFQLLEAAVLCDVEAVQHYDSCCDARPEHIHRVLSALAPASVACCSIGDDVRSGGFEQVQYGRWVAEICWRWQERERRTLRNSS